MQAVIRLHRANNYGYNLDLMILRNIFSDRTICKAVAAIILPLLLHSCAALKEDYNSECETGVKIKLQVAVNVNVGTGVNTSVDIDSSPAKVEKFYAEVHSVKFFVFDSTGTYIDVWGMEGKELLQKNDYTMDIPLGKGFYNVVALTGLEDAKYIVPTLTKGVSTIEDLNVKLERDAQNHQDKYLIPLWTGYTSKAVEVKEFSLTPIIIYVNVRKLTNTVIALLQDLSGKEVLSENYDFEIKADNGYLNSKGSLMPDDTITYSAYLKSNEQIESATIARAEMNTLRFDAKKNTRFVVTEKNATKADGTPKKILDINLTKYLLLTRSLYEGKVGFKLTEQQYLDYEDEYAIVFFLTPTGKVDDPYICVTININGWIIRLNEFEL